MRIRKRFASSHFRSTRYAAARRRCPAALRPPGRGLPRERKIDRHGSAAGWWHVNPNDSAVRFDNAARDGQAETGSPMLRREEGLECFLTHLLGHAWTAVGNRDQAAAIGVRYRHFDSALTLHRLRGVH